MDAVVMGGRLYQQFTPLLSQFHLAIFYMYGKFYQFSKRLSGINYVNTFILLSNYNPLRSIFQIKHLMYGYFNLLIDPNSQDFRC